MCCKLCTVFVSKACVLTLLLLYMSFADFLNRFHEVLSMTFSVLQATMKVTIDNTEFKLDNVKEGSAVAIDVAGETAVAAAAPAVRPIC